MLATDKRARCLKTFLGLLALSFLLCVPQGHAQSESETPKKLSSLMHVFAYTPVPTATPADFAAFEKATKELVGKVPGLRKVWVGKLRRPLKIGDVQREYGVAMEFDDEAALNAYATHPAHEVWIKAYEKVRVEGTTTYDILVE